MPYKNYGTDDADNSWRQPYAGTRMPPSQVAPREGERPGTVIIEESGGPPKAKEVTEWFNEAVPYTNLAGTRERDDRALNFSKHRIQWWEEKTQGVRARWRLNNHVFRGNTVSRLPGMPDVHVPELFKRREALVPRIEKAFLSADPPFRAEGRRKAVRKQATLVAAHLHYQLHQARWTELIQPTSRCLITHGVYAWHVNWEVQTARLVKREVTKRMTDLGAEYDIKRKYEEQVTFQGPRIYLIDPLDFFIDTTKCNVRDALFVGHRTRMTRGQIYELGRRGIFKNTDQLLNAAPAKLGAGWAEEDKRAKSYTERWGSEPMHKTGDGGPDEFTVINLYCLYDLFNDGREIETLITIVNNGVIVRLMENPHDEKIRPYATGSLSMEGFEFYGGSTFDPAVRLNAELDQHRQLVLAGQNLHVSPFITTELDADMPDTLLGLLPGKVFPGVGKAQVLNTPDVAHSLQILEDVLRRDIDEVTGVPNLYLASGQDAAATATEIDYRTRQANERSVSPVRAIENGLVDALRIMHQYNRQYMTRSESFRVIGKAAKNLGDYVSIEPTDYTEDMDFEFKGPQQLQNLGLRQTALEKFITISTPIAAMHQDKIDFLELLHQYFEAAVGPLLDKNPVNVGASLDEMLDPEQENAFFLLRGEAVEIHEEDPDEEHIPSHEKSLAYAEEQDMPESVIRAHKNHILNHELSKGRKKMRRMAAESRAPSYSSGPRPPEERPGLNDAGGGVKPATPPPGSSAGSPSATPDGQAPGPARVDQMATPGRSQAVFQNEEFA